MFTTLCPLLSRTALILATLCVANARAQRFSARPGASLPGPVNDTVTTQHDITLGGVTLPYTATAGHLTVTAPSSGAPEAAFFYVAYTVDDQPPDRRPITFFYNGGPGSSSAWLHLGSFGPKRLVTGNPSTTQRRPFPLVDNEDSLLDTTDLVFVDAVGTGLSEAVAPNTNLTFWGVDEDAKVFRDYVQQFLAANGRLKSPVHLFGESYGTPRTAVLANELARSSIRINLAGLVLQSAVLNYNTNGAMASRVSCAGYLPTYGATGAYYNLLTPAPTDLLAFYQEMRDFSAESYAPAVTAWLKEGTEPSSSLLAKLHDTTGIDTQVWQGDLNLHPSAFQRDLLPNVLIGRFDSRMSAPIGSILASQGDPSSTFISKPFDSAIKSYLSDFLNYGHGEDYTILSKAANYWNFYHDGLPLPDTIPDLATAMSRLPHMKVLALSGYHDLATPFYQTELDLGRLEESPNLDDQVYNGGHMVYLDDESRPKERADLVAYYLGEPEAWTSALSRPEAPSRVWPGPALVFRDLSAAQVPDRNPLIDPYVPPEKCHVTPGTETTGAELQAQVERKLREPEQP